MKARNKKPDWPIEKENMRTGLKSHPFLFIGVSKVILVVLGCLEISHSNEDSTKIYLKYVFISAPQYSTDGTTYTRTRNEFAFKHFYPEFKDLYGKKYGYAPIQKAESDYMWANVVGIPGGLLLGLGTSLLMFHQHDGGIQSGTIFVLASAPLVYLSLKWEFDSYKSIRDGMK